uniref:Uncharacterized protein n=1 Tax=Arundo donax TaxID=35708 RepID=A0A0A8ZEF3_ARUDO
MTILKLLMRGMAQISRKNVVQLELTLQHEMHGHLN